MDHEHDATYSIKNRNMSEGMPDKGAQTGAEQAPSNSEGDTVQPALLL